MELDMSRVALLSLSEADGAAISNRRMVAGASALERQVDLALAAGCGRIWLLASRQDDVAIAAQHLAESGGARFRLLTHGRQLLGALRQQDELVVLAEGLVVGQGDGLAMLTSGPALLRLPADSGMNAGFERLDRDYAWGGAMVLPGRIVEQLEALPDDMEPVSALLRAARAARISESDLPEEWLAAGEWSLQSEGRSSGKAGSGPEDGGEVTVRAPAERVGAALVGRNTIANVILCASLLAVIAAVAGLYFSQFAIALGLVALAIAGLRTWFAYRRERDPRFFSGKPPTILPDLSLHAPDLVGLIAVAAALATEFPIESAIYMTLLTYFCWILARSMSARGRSLFRHHELIWATFVIFGAFNAWFIGVAALTIVAVSAIGLDFRRGSIITRT
ncbi:hypothetical protein [Erythrobacter litoralis]|uniref:Uncharacterized protein n=1 Tax=Erythrobacter litoralis (strain HTCC2594) TaxID=314225 RepID=Q2NA86_ERYLH|nr:hypothetical protein [Erythrobacter litoralis]ABC63405.1 hypothetical protein ELI_06565 [Erythrobacter litoralis HTCC2594]